MIYGERIRQARELLGETQTHFGQEIGLPQSRVSQAESANQDLAEDILWRLCEHTGFPPSFFEQAPTSRVDEYQFRARLRFTKADRNRAVRSAELVHEAFELMRREAASVPVRVPDLRGADPRSAAQAVRQAMGMDLVSPIGNLTLPVERLGVVVLALPTRTKKHDAFCWWHPDRRKPYPVIATLDGAPGDRLRWSLAHELGHVALHADGGSGQEIESEADQFAAELLTPLEGLRTVMPNRPTLGALYAMKAQWKVSAQSLIRRGKELGAVSDDQYLSLFRQISARGERMNERYAVAREKPRAFRKMAEVLYGPSPAEGLASVTSWTLPFAQDVLERFASRSDLPSRRSFAATPPAGNVIPLRRRPG